MWYGFLVLNGSITAIGGLILLGLKLGSIFTSKVLNVFEWFIVFCVLLMIGSIVPSPDSSFKVARFVELFAGAAKKDFIDYHVDLEFLPWPSSLLGLALAASDLLFSSTI